MSATDDISQINALLDQIGQKLVDEPGYRDAIQDDQVGELAGAGASALGLAQSLAAAGDVEGFSFDPFSMREASGIRLNTVCLGTCKRNTIHIEIDIETKK